MSDENRRLKVNPLYYHDFSRWLLGQALNLRDVQKVSAPLRKRLQEGSLTKQDVVILISFNNEDINEAVFRNHQVPGALLYKCYLKNTNVGTNNLTLLSTKLDKYKRTTKSKLRLLKLELSKNSKDISSVCSILWRDFDYPSKAIYMCSSYIINQCIRGLSRSSPNLANTKSLKTIDKDTLVSEVKEIINSKYDTYEIVSEFVQTLAGNPHSYNYYSSSTDVKECASYLNTFNWVNTIKEALLNIKSDKDRDSCMSNLISQLKSLESQQIITQEDRIKLILALDVDGKSESMAIGILIKDIQQLYKKEGCHDGE